MKHMFSFMSPKVGHDRWAKKPGDIVVFTLYLLSGLMVSTVTTVTPLILFMLQ